MLMEHNKEAYEQFKTILLEHKECCLVAATGVGKTYITLQLIKDLNLKSLILCHRMSIQCEWIKVCNKYDIIHNINFTTYQMFHNHPDMFNGYDIYIFDEAHHMGSAVWGNSIKEFRSKLNSNTMVIGLTADPNRYEIKVRRQINNVALTLFNGHVVYGHDRKDAIDSGIFLPAQYVYAIFDTEGIYSRYSKMEVTDELIGRLDLTIRNSLKIGEILNKHTSRLSKIKGILFVENISSIPDGQKLIADTFPNLKQYVIHSKLSKLENSNSIKLFEESDSGFMISVDMINEGVHFSKINTIVMLRKTSSPSLYNQQIGRAFSSKAIENAVIFDLVGNVKSIKSTLNKFITDPLYCVVKGIKDNSIWEENISDQHIVYDYATDILDILDEIDLYTNRHWSEEEDQILKDNYPTMGYNVNSLLPGRSKNACRIRAITLNIYSDKCYWSTEEDQILKDNYPTMGSNVCNLLPGRSEGACRVRARILKIYHSTNSIKWSEEEDQILKDNYPTMGPNVCNLLPGRSEGACRARATQNNIYYRSPTWSEEEDQILKDNYPTMGPNVCNLLPGRSEGACKRRALMFEIYYRIKWSEEEDQIIKDNYPTMGSKTCNLLPGRSGYACKCRAGILGVKKITKSKK